MTELADLARALAAVLWVVLAVVVIVILRGLIRNSGALSRLSVGATGVSMEFVTERLTAVSAAAGVTEAAGDESAQLAVFRRLQRSAGILRGARVLWVDDHPESILPVVDILSRYATAVVVARSNDDAFRFLSNASFDAVVSDVGRDDEGPESDLKGIELADTVYRRYGLKSVLFTTRFNVETLPNRADAERLRVAGVVQRAVQGVTTDIEEVLHLILDSIDRRAD